MGCDYYIEQHLEIRDKNDTITTITLDTIRGYYGDIDCGPADSDYEDAHNIHHWDSPEMTHLWDTYKKILLTPNSPLLIFKDGLFVKDSYKYKYEEIILNEMREQGIQGEQGIQNVYEIYKCETRRER